MKGNKNAAIGEMLGVSEKTIERAKFVENNATEEQMEAIESGEATINSTYDELKGKKKKVEPVEEDDSDRSNNDFEEDFDPFEDNIDDLSESLNDNEGNPRGLFFNHSDGIERPDYKLSPEEDDERTRERRSAYLQGFSEGFYKALVFACAEISKGKTPEEVYKDERVSDLSPSVIEKFELPDDAEDIVGRW